MKHAGGVKARLLRKGSKAIVGGMRPPDDPLASWFGRVRVGLPGETWPASDGKPMMALCQLNLTELPYKPDNLSDIALIAIFVPRDNLPADGAANGDTWLLRAYPKLDDLVAIDEPSERTSIKPCAIRWESIEEDFPTWDDAATMDLPASVEDDYDERFPNIDGTKVGGWPTTVQSEVFWAPNNAHPANPEFVLQIASEPKAHWAWGDGGVGYIGRGTGDDRDMWTIAWQTY